MRKMEGSLPFRPKGDIYVRAFQNPIACQGLLYYPPWPFFYVAISPHYAPEIETGNLTNKAGRCQMPDGKLSKQRGRLQMI